MTRRFFLKMVTLSVTGLTASFIAFAGRVGAQTKKLVKGLYIRGSKILTYKHELQPGRNYAMLIDCAKCIGCESCAETCREEYELPDGVWRSWVKFIEREEMLFLPRLCNHCDNPPCATVCPVSASYKREDGIVLTDYKKCIGCKYCMIACPYDARFLHPIHKVSDKCTFCDHRLEEGLLPACVEVCPVGARIFGDLNNPESEISKLIAQKPVQVLRKDMGTKPKVYYIALDIDITPTEEMAEEYSGGGK
jgi:tetrathionate reductase subunit B